MAKMKKPKSWHPNSISCASIKMAGWWSTYSRQCQIAIKKLLAVPDSLSNSILEGAMLFDWLTGTFWSAVQHCQLLFDQLYGTASKFLTSSQRSRYKGAYESAPFGVWIGPKMVLFDFWNPNLVGLHILGPVIVPPLVAGVGHSNK